MNSLIKPSKNKLHIFHEGRKRRAFVGTLTYVKDKNCYELIYDEDYIQMKNAIPLSPELSLFKGKHTSKVGELFPALYDRIPSKQNPAYEDYCHSQNIKPDEKNLIILLGSIGRRGPSSFVFEPVYENKFSANDLVNLRNKMGVTQHDLAEAFDIKLTTLQRIESGISHDKNTLKLLQIYLTIENGNVGLWQLKQTGSRVHHEAFSKINDYLQSHSRKKSSEPSNQNRLLSNCKEYYFLLSDKLNSEVKSTSHCKALYTQLIITLHDLLESLKSARTHITFSDDIKKSKYVEDVFDLIRVHRNIICHDTSGLKRIYDTNMISSFNIFYTKGKFQIGTYSIESLYSDDIAISYGSWLVYLQRHLKRTLDNIERHLQTPQQKQ